MREQREWRRFGDYTVYTHMWGLNLVLVILGFDRKCWSVSFLNREQSLS